MTTIKTPQENAAGREAHRIMRELLNQPKDNPAQAEFCVYVVHQFDLDQDTHFAVGNCSNIALVNQTIHLILQSMQEHGEIDGDCEHHMRLFDLASRCADRLRAESGSPTLVFLAQPATRHGCFATSRPWNLLKTDSQSDEEYDEHSADSRATCLQAAHDYWVEMFRRSQGLKPRNTHVH